MLEGLFALAGRLFGIEVEAADGEVPVWHQDVRFFRVMQVSQQGKGVSMRQVAMTCVGG